MSDINLLIDNFGKVKGKLIIVMIICEYNKKYKEITKLFDNDVFIEAYNNCNNWLRNFFF